MGRDPFSKDLADPNLSDSLQVSSFTPSGLDKLPEEDPTEREQHLSFSCPVDHVGSTVYVQGWAKIHCELPPVIFVHDLGENSDVYAYAARLLLQQGFNTYCYDMRGHGRSAILDNNKLLCFDDLVSDLLQVVAWIRYKSQRRKPFLIGQGVGALVLMHFQKYYPQYCSRSVLLAPTFEEQTALPFFNRLILRGMSHLMPDARLPGTILPYFLPMSDESHHRAEDVTFSARFTHDLMLAIRNSAQTFYDVSTPNLIACPVDDILYNSNQLRRHFGQHPHHDMFNFEEIKGISAQALSRDPEETKAFLNVIIPWMQEICPTSTLL